MYVRLLVALLLITPPSGRGFVVLSKVFLVRFYPLVCPYYWVVAAVGTYPRHVLRDSQPITDCRPISKRGTSETA